MVSYISNSLTLVKNFFNYVLDILFPIQCLGCGREGAWICKECFENIDLHGEIHRFIPGILRWQGFSIGEIKVEHEPRTAGQTKYGPKRILKGFVDMIGVWFWRKYSSRPLHLFGGSGIILTILGCTGLLILIIARLFFQYSLSTSIWPLMATLFILLGILLVVTGLLADMITKQYYSGEHTAYSIKNVVKH